MLIRNIYLSLVGIITVMSSPLYANGLTFGIVAKTIDDANFVETWRGCQQRAQLFNDKCVLVGANGSAHIRRQSHSLQKALLSNQFDALAISVIKSDVIAKELASSTIPIITYDSPFDSAYSQHSQAFIGIDNQEFGRDLAKLAIQLKPHGGSLCIMTAKFDENLAQRVIGVRQQLSGDQHFPEDHLLTGQGGWTESPRCPWDSADDSARTMAQVAVTLSTIKPDVFLSVGHWPIVDANAYREVIKPYKSQLINHQTAVIVATGMLSVAQTELLDDNLVHGFVSINFNEIGKISYDTMKLLVNAYPVKRFTYISNSVTTNMSD